MNFPEGVAMTETENLILEHLRAIRASQDRHGEDLQDIKHRMTSLESKVAILAGDMANLTHRLDLVDTRGQRIGHRLDLVGAPAAG